MSFTKILATNNAGTTLAAPISPTDTSLTLATGTGSKFPNPNNGIGEFFVMTLIDQNVGIARNEIIYVTSRSGDVCTVVRAQEGSSSQSWAVGDVAANLLTAGSIQYFTTDLTGYVTFTNSGIFSNKRLDTADNNIIAINGITLTSLAGGGHKVVLDTTPAIFGSQLFNTDILSLGADTPSSWFITAAGSNQSSATSLNHNVSIINAGSGGVRFNPSTSHNGVINIIYNISSSDLELYPPSGWTITQGIISTSTNQPILLPRGSSLIAIEDDTNITFRVLLIGQQLNGAAQLPLTTGITAGTSSGTAGQLLPGYNKVTSTAGGVNAVKLPSNPGNGIMVWLYGRAGVTLTVYPTGSGTLYWIGNDAGSSSAICAEGTQIWVNDGGDNWVMMASTGF